MVGVERGATLIDRLVKKRADVDGSDMEETPDALPTEIPKLTTDVKDSIDTVNENLKDLEKLLAQGKQEEAKRKFSTAKPVKAVRTRQESEVSVKKKREEKAARKSSLKESKKKVKAEQVKLEVMTGKWGPDEKDRYIEGIRLHGKDFEKIAEHVGTRNFS